MNTAHKKPYDAYSCVYSEWKHFYTWDKVQNSRFNNFIGVTMTETCLTNTHTNNKAQEKDKKDIHTRHATKNYIQNYFAEPYGGISASKMIYPYFTDFVYLLKGERKMVS